MRRRYTSYAGAKCERRFVGLCYLRDVTRRKARAAGAWVMVAIGVFLAAWALWWEPGRLIQRSQTLELPCWQSEPIRVAVISDLHVGAPYIDESKVRRIVELVNADEPDVVVLLGDYVVQGVIGGRFVPPETTAAILGGLRSRRGVYAVLGNHDWWLNASRVSAALRSAGIHVIDDTSLPITTTDGHFWLVGISDYTEGKHDVASALSFITDESPAIAITHSPDIFPVIPKRICLTFAGHTHGGQVALPVVGRLIVPSRYGQRYAIGHIHEQGRDMVVTAGVGTSIIPVRFRVPPEILFVTIKKVAPAA